MMVVIESFEGSNSVEILNYLSLVASLAKKENKSYQEVKLNLTPDHFIFDQNYLENVEIDDLGGPFWFKFILNNLDTHMER